jgi:hypothetical protein
MIHHKIFNQGYIAVTSVLLISLLLITITAALSMTNYFSRYNILENEFKERSSGLAEACVDYAIGQLAVDNSYAGNNPAVPVGVADTCSVGAVTAVGPQKQIITQGVFPKNVANQSYTNLKILVNANLSVASWQETPN